MLHMMIRPEAAADIAAVRRLLTVAFDGTAEATLVDSLRRDGDLTLALVADSAGAVIGHVGFPRLTLVTDGRNIPVRGLAPLAVQADVRRQGIGAKLVKDGLARLRDAGEGLVFVLGDPQYYGRFGFDAPAASEFACAYQGPYFQVLRLTPSAPLSGRVRYPRAFAELG
jgi:putative acetyltransferase